MSDQPIETTAVPAAPPQPPAPPAQPVQAAPPAQAPPPAPPAPPVEQQVVQQAPPPAPAAPPAPPAPPAAPAAPAPAQPVQQAPAAPQAPPPAPPAAPAPPTEQAPQAPAQPVQQAAPPAAPAPAAVPAVPAAPSVPAVPAQAARPAGDIEGLEDVDSSDLTMPYLRIIGREGVFQDSLSNEKFEQLDVVMLGLVKQRVLWPPQMEENGPKEPLCRSRNFTQGVPGDRFRAAFNGVTPQQASGFSHEEIDAAQQGGAPLECTRCNLKNWNSRPDGQNPPWCTEQHTFLVLLNNTPESFGYPAIFTVQRSAIKNSKNYLTSFTRSRQAMFTARTTLSLDVRSRGDVSYSVPIFTRGTATDPALAEQFAATYRSGREFLQTKSQVDEEEVTVEVRQTAPAAPPVEQQYMQGTSVAAENIGVDTSDPTALPW